MIKKILVLAAGLGLALDCFAQATLTIPAPTGTQCSGADCVRQGAGGGAPVSSGSSPSVPTTYVQTGPSYVPTGPAVAPGINPDLLNASRMPDYARTEFEKFVQAAVGRDLRLFGHEFFEEVPTTFAPVDRIPVRGDYVIGPGDELLIRAWGKIDLDARPVVDRNGQIYIPRVGAINVADIRYDQLNSFIHAAIGRFFKDFELNVTIGQLRSIQVFVLGYARRPGTYTVSSLSTLVNTLFASGGPASEGSMRHVQLKRNNVLVTDLDVYDLILKGDKSGDAPLRSGDVIYIPPVGPLVAVAGSVNRPAIYELRQSATLGETVGDAGGLTAVAGAKRASLERIDERSERVFDEFALDRDGLRRELKDGDVVRIYPISPKITNAVTLRGNVAQPGRYLWHEGMRVSDLIPSRDTLITREYWNAQNSIVPGVRRDEDEFGVRVRQTNVEAAENVPGPQIAMNTGLNGAGERIDGSNLTLGGPETLYSSSRRSVSLSRGASSLNTTPNDAGSLNIDGRAYPNRNLDGRVLGRDEEEDNQQDLRTEIKHRGSEINWEYAVVERLNPGDLTTELITFNLGLAVDKRSPSSRDNPQLQPGDVVTVFSQKDVPVATENRAKFVQVAGEVKAPGVYRVEPGETLRDVVRQAGGLGSHAYLYGSELLRESAQKEQHRRLLQMVERMQRELTEASAVNVSLNAEDRTAAQTSIQEQRAFIDRLARVRPTGRVILQLKPTDTQSADIPAIPLEDGDIFTVPAKGDTVQVLGSVYNENTFRFQPGQEVARYLSIAGGPTRGADKSRMFIIRADGSVISRQQQSGLLHGDHFVSMRLMPGDAIVVPQRFKTRSGLSELRDWTAVFSQLALGAAAINIIK